MYDSDEKVLTLSIYMKSMNEAELLKKYNNIYLEIITRYKDYIEENEGLSVVALPKLVTPEDGNVEVVVRGIKEKFPLYSYEENFYDAAAHAYDYVRNNITEISLPFQFWLKPGEAIRYEAGDRFDMAVLLCSILLALGSANAKAIVVSKESGSSFHVYFEWKGRFTLMNLGNGMADYNSFEELTGSLGIMDSEEVSAYEFNDKLYNDLA